MRSRPIATPLSESESARLASMEARAEEPEALRRRVATAAQIAWIHSRAATDEALWQEVADAGIAVMRTPVQP